MSHMRLAFVTLHACRLRPIHSLLLLCTDRGAAKIAHLLGLDYAEALCPRRLCALCVPRDFWRGRLTKTRFVRRTGRPSTPRRRRSRRSATRPSSSDGRNSCVACASASTCASNTGLQPPRISPREGMATRVATIKMRAAEGVSPRA
ncbi:hypothetical protein EDB83DRAFT_106854 [Lactarius deliciosus]|nr:hypothetical protein EDB83DRAFT_106854 [Lactarius deliciosus]